ncbi:MAG: hypothetical protein IPI60_08000 [Saprospiraceae bacterium]|nr:hypothetical protein [Saprospiraceae bacterium]
MMKVIFLLLLFFCQVLPFDLIAQDEQQQVSDSTANGFTVPMTHGTKSVGLNMTPMLKQLIPFNRSNISVAGPYFVQFRRIKKSGVLARSGLGWNLGTTDFDIPNINLRFGWERRRNFYSRWTYNRGFDFVFSTGGINIDSGNDNFEAFLGVQFTWGLDYFVLPNVSLNLETGLAVGIGSDNSFTTFFIPPISLNLNYWYVKM